ncbi:hypothetical protein TorRG33x02_206440 [Trema orientale]|uniref:Uncharacterized protein n=1 Tax=Trema orientale TaxID=63057 RepID=A0A2P5EDH8_TREOI|nr:hypothetical protein TorRG33x02_206440 [Trema orientale]
MEDKRRVSSSPLSILVIAYNNSTHRRNRSSRFAISTKPHHDLDDSSPLTRASMVVSTFLLILISTLVYNTTMNSPFWAFVLHQCRLLQSPQRGRQYHNRSRIWT